MDPVVPQRSKAAKSRAPATAKRTADRLPPARLNIVRAELARGRNPADISRELAEKWSCTERVIRKYMRRVYDEWAKTEPQKRAQSKARLRNLLNELLEAAMGAGTVAEGDKPESNPELALRVIDRMLRLDGLEEAVKVQTTGETKVTGSLQVVDLSPAERARKLAALQAKVNAAREKAAPAPLPAREPGEDDGGE